MSSSRGEVDFEVAGVDDDTDGGIDGQGDAIHQGMGDADGLDGKRPDGELFLGLNLDEGGFVEEIVFFEVSLDQGQGELGAVDGDLEFAEKPGEAADVVLVAVVRTMARTWALFSTR